MGKKKKTVHTISGSYTTTVPSKKKKKPKTPKAPKTTKPAGGSSPDVVLKTTQDKKKKKKDKSSSFKSTDAAKVSKQIKRIKKGKPPLKTDTKKSVKKATKRLRRITKRNAIYTGRESVFKPTTGAEASALSGSKAYQSKKKLAEKGEKDRKITGEEGNTALRTIPSRYVREGKVQELQDTMPKLREKLEKARKNQSKTADVLNTQLQKAESQYARLVAVQHRLDAKQGQRALKNARKDLKKFKHDDPLLLGKGKNQEETTKGKILKSLKDSTEDSAYQGRVAFKRFNDRKGDIVELDKRLSNNLGQAIVEEEQRKFLADLKKKKNVTFNDLERSGVQAEIHSVNGKVIPKEQREQYQLRNFYKGGPLGTVKDAEINVTIGGKSTVVKMPIGPEEDVAKALLETAMLVAPIPVGKLLRGAGAIKAAIAGSRAGMATKTSARAFAKAHPGLARSLKLVGPRSVKHQGYLLKKGIKRDLASIAKASGAEKAILAAKTSGAVLAIKAAGKGRAKRKAALDRLSMQAGVGTITDIEWRLAKKAARGVPLSKKSKAAIEGASKRTGKQGGGAPVALQLQKDFATIARPYSKVERAAQLGRLSALPVSKSMQTTRAVMGSPVGTYAVGLPAVGAIVNPKAEAQLFTDFANEAGGILSDIANGEVSPGDLVDGADAFVDAIPNLAYTGMKALDMALSDIPGTIKGLGTAAAGLVIVPFYLAHEAATHGLLDTAKNFGGLIADDVAYMYGPAIEGDWELLSERMEEVGPEWYLLDLWPAAAGTSFAAKGVTLGAVKGGYKVLPGKTYEGTRAEKFLEGARPAIRRDVGRRGVEELRISNRLVKATRQRVADALRADLTRRRVGRHVAAVKKENANQPVSKREKFREDLIPLKQREVLPLWDGRKSSGKFIPILGPIVSRYAGMNRYRVIEAARVRGIHQMRYNDYLKTFVTPYHNIIRGRSWRDEKGKRHKGLNREQQEFLGHVNMIFGDPTEANTIIQRLIEYYDGSRNTIQKNPDLNQLLREKIPDLSEETAREILINYENGFVAEAHEEAGRILDKERMPQQIFEERSIARGDGVPPPIDDIARVKMALELRKMDIIRMRRKQQWANPGTPITKYDEISVIERVLDNIDRAPEKIFTKDFGKSTVELNRLMDGAAKIDPVLKLQQMESAAHQTQLAYMRRVWRYEMDAKQRGHWATVRQMIEANGDSSKLDKLRDEILDAAHVPERMVDYAGVLDEDFRNAVSEFYAELFTVPAGRKPGLAENPLLVELMDRSRTAWASPGTLDKDQMVVLMKSDTYDEFIQNIDRHVVSDFTPKNEGFIAAIYGAEEMQTSQKTSAMINQGMGQNGAFNLEEFSGRWLEGYNDAKEQGLFGKPEIVKDAQERVHKASQQYLEDIGVSEKVLLWRTPALDTAATDAKAVMPFSYAMFWGDANHGTGLSIAARNFGGPSPPSSEIPMHAEPYLFNRKDIISIPSAAANSYRGGHVLEVQAVPDEALRKLSLADTVPTELGHPELNPYRSMAAKALDKVQDEMRLLDEELAQADKTSRIPAKGKADSGMLIETSGAYNNAGFKSRNDVLRMSTREPMLEEERRAFFLEESLADVGAPLYGHGLQLNEWEVVQSKLDPESMNLRPRRKGEEEHLYAYEHDYLIRTVYSPEGDQYVLTPAFTHDRLERVYNYNKRPDDPHFDSIGKNYSEPAKVRTEHTNAPTRKNSNIGTTRYTPEEWEVIKHVVGKTEAHAIEASKYRLDELIKSANELMARSELQTKHPLGSNAFLDHRINIEQARINKIAKAEFGFGSPFFYHARPIDLPARKLSYNERTFNEKTAHLYPGQMDKRQGWLYDMGLMDLDPRSQVSHLMHRGYRVRDFGILTSTLDAHALTGADAIAFLKENNLALPKGTKKKNGDVTITTRHQLEDAMQDAGMSLDEYVLINRDRLHENIRNVLEGDPIIPRSAKGKDTLDFVEKMRTSLADMLETSQGHGTGDWVAVHNRHFEHINSNLNKLAESRVIRTYVDMPKAFTSRILLAPNISWLQFQFYANSLLSGIAGVGPGAAVAANVKYSKAPKSVKDAMDLAAGVQTHHLDISKMNQNLNGFWHDWLTKSHMYERHLDGRNFLDAFFFVDRKNNQFWRNAVLYNGMKKAAYKRMGKSGSRIMRGMDKFWKAVAKRQDKNKMSFNQAMTEVANDTKLMDQLARDMESFMGDYLNFSVTERQIMQRSVMFYGFLRHSMQFTLWNLPVKHPMRLGFLAQLSELAINDVKAMQGVDDLDHRLLGKFYLKGPVKVPILGELQPLPGEALEIDLARASVAGNFFLDALQTSNPLQKMLASTNPFYLPMLEALSGTKLFQGTPLRSENDPTFEWNRGSWAAFSSLGDDSGFRYLANRYLELIRPVRIGAQVASDVPPWRRSDTSLPFDQQPFHYDIDGEAYKEARKDKVKYQDQQNRVFDIFKSLGGLPVQRELLALFPSPSTDSELIAFLAEQKLERRKLKKKEAREVPDEIDPTKHIRPQERAIRDAQKAAEKEKQKSKITIPGTSGSSSSSNLPKATQQLLGK